MIKSPFIFKTLDISTIHMRKEDGDRLNHPDAPAYTMDEYGWLVLVGDMEDWWSYLEDMSEEFKNVLKAAEELGCDYVRFDRDGHIYDLPQFDW